MKRIYIILMLLLSGVVTYATDVKTLAEEATKMYQEGDYQKAIDLYNEMLSDDMESATVYYNLGNCYYKQGETAKAILNYERALLSTVAFCAIVRLYFISLSPGCNNKARS